MNKTKISVSIDSNVLKELKQKVKQGQFANLSFAIEYHCRMGLIRGGGNL